MVKKKKKAKSKKAGKKKAIGRPPRYKTAQALQSKIDKYIKKNTENPTITGLAYYLGFESRQAFYHMENKPEFSYTIKRARMFMESYYESKLVGNNCTGSIFALKNFGWVDKHEVSGPDGGPVQMQIVDFAGASKPK